MNDSRIQAEECILSASLQPAGNRHSTLWNAVNCVLTELMLWALYPLLVSATCLYKQCTDSQKVSTAEHPLVSLANQPLQHLPSDLSSRYLCKQCEECPLHTATAQLWQHELRPQHSWIQNTSVLISRWGFPGLLSILRTVLSTIKTHLIWEAFTGTLADQIPVPDKDWESFSRTFLCFCVK